MKKLAIESVSVRFGSVQALKDVSLDFSVGETVGLVGPNGSGKSTLIRILLGLVRPDAGRMTIDGKHTVVDNAFKRMVGYLPESVAFSENLTGNQVTRFFSRARRVNDKRRREVLEIVGLAAAAKRQVRGYSRGMRQRLGLGLSILAEPSILILDEPTGGLDQQGLQVLWRVIREWREAGRIVIIATHDLALMESRLDRISLLQSGKLRADDTPAGLREMTRLPIEVTFGLPSTEQEIALDKVESWERCIAVSQAEGEFTVSVAPGDLLALVQHVSDAIPDIENVRVREPGMDAIYDHIVAS